MSDEQSTDIMDNSKIESLDNQMDQDETGRPGKNELHELRGVQLFKDFPPNL